MGKRCLGAEHGGRAGLGAHSCHACLITLGTVTDSTATAGSLARLRTGQLEQAKLCSFDLLASVWENSSRWCPTQAADLHDNLLGTLGQLHTPQVQHRISLAAHRYLNLPVLLATPGP